MARLDGKVAIITGAARGIGAAAARLFAAEGASVMLADVLAEPLQKVATEIGAKAAVCPTDVTDEAAFAALTGDDVGVKVGSGPSRAPWRVDSPVEVVDLLGRVLDVRRARVAERAG